MKLAPVCGLFLRLGLSVASLATFVLAQPTAGFAQAAHATSAPVDRVRGPVTEARTALTGQVHPMGRTAVDLGEVPASMSTGRMVLWLRRSAEQQTQLTQFLSHAQNSGSAIYRKWMTPEAYGAAYGISNHDLEAVQQWLQSSGLKVERVSAGRNAMLFSGTAGSLGSAFHTSIHSYSVGLQTHYSNAKAPEVPTALAAVIAGVSPMNDFRPRPMHVLGTHARYDAASRHLQPALTGTDSGGNKSLFVTPADASIIYDTPNQNYNPAATQTFDGTGVTIGIIGYSALQMDDVQNYRTAFVPAASISNLPQQILDGGIDPGVLPGGNAVEALLDVEVAGGIAPGAAIKYYYAGSTDLSDGLILSGLRALEDNKVSILSVSYGQCEADLGPNGNLAWSELWQQAAAQGISVTVSTGDSGSATCDGDTSSPPSEASRGLSVSGIASTPYNIAVGGTDFYPLLANFSTYVNTDPSAISPYYATALSYIPENPWNDSSGVVGSSFTDNMPSSGGSGATNIIGGGGGLSSQAICSEAPDAYGNCEADVSGYPQPAYQTSFQQSTSVRAIPDVALLAGNGFYGAGWVFCADAGTEGGGGAGVDCQVDANGRLNEDQNVGVIGGTSASAPAFAGMLAMISQSQGGVRLGQANNVLYNLAQDYNPDPNSPGKYQRSFHDVAIGNNSVYCTTYSQDCGSNNFLNGYNATPSYDMATGLGSIDLAQLINLWPTTNFATTSSTITAGAAAGSLSADPISVVHGTPLYFATAVTPSTATGQFSLLTTNSATAASSADFGILGSNGNGSLVTNDLPGGTYSVSAYYAGDTGATGSESSNSISLTISAEPSTIHLFFGGYDPTTFLLNEGTSTLPYGFNSYVSAQPYGNSSATDANGNLLTDGLATGSITFTANGVSQSGAISSVGLAQISAKSLAPGAYAYQASYAGDASFAPSISPVQTLTITKAPTSFILDPSAVTVDSINPLYLSAVLQTDSVALFPTGKVLANVNGHSYAPQFSTEAQPKGVGAITFLFLIPAADLAPGSNIVSVSYDGDTNYQSSAGGGTVTLTNPAGTYSLSGPTQPVVVEASQQGSATVSVLPSSGFTGQVNMACTVSVAPTGHTPICAAGSATIFGTDAVTSALTIATFADTPAALYTITVTGTSGQQSQSVQFPLTITAGPGFTLASSASTLSIAAPGQSVSDTLSITATKAFTGPVGLSCIVSPAPNSGVAPSCTVPASVLLSTSATASLQVASDPTTMPGTYSVAVTAVSGLVQQSLTIPITILAVPATPSFALSADSGTLSIAAAGQSMAETLTISPAGGFSGTVQMSCVVSPSDTTGAATSPSVLPTCALPATASVTGTSAVKATLTVNTTGTSVATAHKQQRLFGERFGGIALSCLLVFLLPRRRMWTVLGVLLLTAVSFSAIGCSSDSSSTGTPPATTPGTPPGSYAVVVTAASGAITTTAKVMVTVQ